MNNLKKLGLSALAGSLVAFSANAGELSVSGSAEFTYTDNDGTTGSGNEITGNPFGAQQLVVFTGSGDVGFGELTVVRSIADAGGSNPTSYSTLDMGSLGTLSFDSNGWGGVGYGANDDILPTAYEEIWTGTAQTNGDILDGSGGSAGVFGYKNTFMGMNVNLEYAPSLSGGDAGDGSSADTTYPDGTSINFAITNNTLVEGLDFGIGYGENDYDRASTDVTSIDTQSTVAYANYSFGPVTVGTTQSYTSGSTNSSGVTIGANEVAIYGIAFNVNENFSLSYTDYENKYLKRGSQGDVTQDTTGINAAYTMGGATLRLTDASMDNVAGVTGTNEDRTEVSLLLAF